MVTKGVTTSSLAKLVPLELDEHELSNRVIPISLYFEIIGRNFWLLALFVAVCVLLIGLVSARLTPVYESTVTISVDYQAPTALIGQDSSRLFGSSTDVDQFMATQMKLIQSDAVLRPVAEKFKLLDRERKPGGNQVERQLLAQAPTELQHLRVIRPPSTYLLLIKYRSTDRQLAADVANAIAESYLRHNYITRVRSSQDLSSFMQQQLAELQAKMQRSDLALSRVERESGMVSPEEKTNIISARLLQLNAELTNAQSDRLKKEAIWQSVQKGSLESVQVSDQAAQLNELSQKISEARQRFAEVKATYGSAHPEYKKSESQVAEYERQFEDVRRNIVQRIDAEYQQAVGRQQMLERALEESGAQANKLNARSFVYQQLKHEADADHSLYEALVRKVQESGINVGFQGNEIRIADLGRPALRPAFPNTPLNISLALVFSTVFGAVVVILRHAFDNKVRDPKTMARLFGTDVIGALPSVRNMPAVLHLTATTQSGPLGVGLLTIGTATTKAQKRNYRAIYGYGEAIRTLRNTINMGQGESPSQTILITSARLGEGKTTTATNLAVAQAEQQRKVLLIDADLRNPSVHRKLGVSAECGVSDVLAGRVLRKDAILSIDKKPNLFLLPAGTSSSRASDVISPEFGKLLEEFKQEFDLIVIDGPPLLGFAEPLELARAVDSVLIVSLVGSTKRQEVADVLAALRRVRANVSGIVLNQLRSDEANGQYGYAYRDTEYTNLSS